MAAIFQLRRASFLAKRPKSPPLRQLNSASRTREHLTPNEVDRLIAAAHQVGGRVAERDALLIMMAYRHGLRASELAGMRWDQIDLKAGLLHVTRRKHGSPSTHPLRGAGASRAALLEAPTRPGGAARFHLAPWWSHDRAHDPLCRRGGGQDGRHQVPRASAHATPRDRLLSGECRP
jgi:integrase